MYLRNVYQTWQEAVREIVTQLLAFEQKVLDCANITFTPAGNIAAANVQDAIEELDTEKAPLASPTFTGTVTIPTPFTLGAVSVTPTGTEINYLAGVTSAIQTQLNAKAVLAANTFTGDQTLGNNNLKTIKTATFNSQTVLSTTTGAVTVDWSAAQNYKQNEPTGTITYTFTAPPGVCHLQLLIDSDGTSSAVTFNFPASVIWYGSTFAHVANKKMVLNFWYDGTSYHGMWATKV